MKRGSILVTGACGEIGRSLISFLAENSGASLVALDTRPPDSSLHRMCHRFVSADITGATVLQDLAATCDFETIYHLAAVLSTSAERNPSMGHHVNVNGTVSILEMAVSLAFKQDREIKVIFPSSIAVYGLPDLKSKAQAGRVRESEWCEPITMYGINKLYCEQLGRYYSRHYRQLDNDELAGRVDFRCLRFPGLISGITLPTGGTSDYAPEMIHMAARGRPYSCFVRSDTHIPFMVMPDAIRALGQLAAAPKEGLSDHVYNVGAFHASAGDIHELVERAFPGGAISYDPDIRRQRIVDSWPTDVDDTKAQLDWGWSPEYGLERSFRDYLIPAISARYRATG